MRLLKKTDKMIFFLRASSGPCSRGLLLTRQPLYWAELSRHPYTPRTHNTFNFTQIKVTVTLQAGLLGIRLIVGVGGVFWLLSLFEGAILKVHFLGCSKVCVLCIHTPYIVGWITLNLAHGCAK